MNGSTVYVKGHPVEMFMDSDGALQMTVGYSDGSDGPLRMTLADWREFAREITSFGEFYADRYPYVSVDDD